MIAYADVVAIHNGGKRSTSAVHAVALALLCDELGNRLSDKIAKEIQRVIAEKDKFKYHGYVAFSEARALPDCAERIGAWCEEWLTVTPRLCS
ncbi:MAG: hypothetical protein IPP90_07050 [Gemmatimonadaceae bacterium]|nr:hypothetical protein [Gemmatimonadaceae bacterium]